MPPPLFDIARIGTGRLYIMPAPFSEQLDGNIGALRHAGIRGIVSLLPPSEMEALGLSAEPRHCRDHGIAFTQFPIEDYCLPEREPFGPLIDGICADLHDGIDVAIHCRAGIGRSGMTACCVLVHEGYDPKAAIATISAARGRAVPETGAQRKFIADFAARL